MSEQQLKANSAARIYTVLKKYQSRRNKDGRTKEAWLESVNLADKDILEKGQPLTFLGEFARKLALLEQELNLLSKKLDSLDINQEIYQPMITELCQLINIQAVTKPQDMNVSDSSFTSLLACSEFLGNEEELILHNEIVKMIDDLKAFYEKVRASDVSPAIKSFVCAQISLMVASLYDYFISGLEALKKMRYEFMSGLFAHRELFEGEQDSKKNEALLKTLWSKFVKISEWIEPINKLLDLPSKVIGMIPD